MKQVEGHSFEARCAAEYSGVFHGAYRYCTTCCNLLQWPDAVTPQKPAVIASNETHFDKRPPPHNGPRCAMITGHPTSSHPQEYPYRQQYPVQQPCCRYWGFRRIPMWCHHGKPSSTAHSQPHAFPARMPSHHTEHPATAPLHCLHSHLLQLHISTLTTPLARHPPSHCLQSHPSHCTPATPSPPPRPAALPHPARRPTPPAVRPPPRARPAPPWRRLAPPRHAVRRRPPGPREGRRSHEAARRGRRLVTANANVTELDGLQSKKHDIEWCMRRVQAAFAWCAGRTAAAWSSFLARNPKCYTHLLAPINTTAEDMKMFCTFISPLLASTTHDTLRSFPTLRLWFCTPTCALRVLSPSASSLSRAGPAISSNPSSPPRTPQLK